MTRHRAARSVGIWRTARHRTPAETTRFHKEPPEERTARYYSDRKDPSCEQTPAVNCVRPLPGAQCEAKRSWSSALSWSNCHASRCWLGTTAGADDRETSQKLGSASGCIPKRAPFWERPVRRDDGHSAPECVDPDMRRVFTAYRGHRRAQPPAHSRPTRSLLR
jgi:hypothetical protein